MRKITLLFAMVFLTMQVFGVALKEVEQDKVTFHNFSMNPYDVSGHIVTVGGNQYNTNSLMVLAGALNTTAGSLVTLALPNNAPVNAGSIVLWAPGTTFPNPSPFLIIDFIQWGAAGQDYEAEAVQAGRWTQGAFIATSLPIKRDNDYTTWGPGNWASSMNIDEDLLQAFVEIGPVPFSTELTVTFEQGHDIQELIMYNVLGELIHHRKVMQSSMIMHITTNELQNGVYLIELRRNGKSSMVKRLIKR